jgi:Holliday junction resolvase RusA-like endonuclease
VSQFIYLYVPVNPEPWAIGPVGYARRGGKMSAYVGQNKQLAAFKEAVAESVREQWGGLPMLEGAIEMRLWFWRQRAAYKTPAARVHRKHEADATNMQKATEDALQGIVFGNDRDVKIPRSVIMEQGESTVGGIVIAVRSIEGWAEAEEDALPPGVRAARIQHIGSFTPSPETDSNAWPPADGAF